jgi:hypothetical protein
MYRILYIDYIFTFCTVIPIILPVFQKFLSIQEHLK